MKSILDPSFKYTPSVSTDIAKTFARIRRMQREDARVVVAAAGELSKNVSVFRRRETEDSKVA